MARGTLFAPTQFPMIAHVASYIPITAVTVKAAIENTIVYVASCTTPSVPASIVMTSKAQNSEHIMTVAGNEIERYSHQPWNDSF